MSSRQLWMALVVALWVGGIGMAQAAPRNQVLRFEADRLDLDPGSGLLRAVGRVRVFFPPYEVRCDQAQVEGPAGKAPRRMVFSGHVEVRRGQDSFRAPRVTYDGNTRRWRAEGGARVQMLLPADAWPEAPASTLF